jgi:hypothetical protein
MKSLQQHKIICEWQSLLEKKYWVYKGGKADPSSDSDSVAREVRQLLRDGAGKGEVRNA